MFYFNSYLAHIIPYFYPIICLLPPSANRMRILGLLTICAEHILTVVNATEYVNLHEKTDSAEEIKQLRGYGIIRWKGHFENHINT